jgi:hypothetical protein
VTIATLPVRSYELAVIAILSRHSSESWNP